MLRDLVHVSHTRNFKTVQSDNRTGFQIVPVVAGSVSGYEPMNNRVLQEIKIRPLVADKINLIDKTKET